MPYIEKTTKAGNLLEVDRCFAMRDGKKVSRGKNEEKSSEEQRNLNNAHAQRRLVQLINANFSRKQGDIFATFTYTAPPDDEAAAKQILNRFTKKVRKYRRANNLPELKYIAITEKQGQWHHHIIMNDLPLKVLDELWGRGRVTISTLDDTYTFKDLASYLIKQDKQAKIKPAGENIKEPRRKFSRRWSSSKNLKKPEVTKRHIKRISKTEPKPPKGYRLLPDWKIGCDRFGNLYQHFSCVKIDEPDAKPKAKRKRE